MPTRKPYPLDAVLRHREQRLEDRARELSVAAREAETASQKRASAEHARERHAAQVRELEQQEQQHLSDGHLQVDDLLRLQAWQIAQSEVARSHSQRLVQAEEAARLALQKQQQSRQQLAGAQGDAELSRRHRDAFEARERTREQECAEQDADEAYNARRSKAPS